MVKNILLVNARLLILLLSETAGGRLHDKRLAEVTPYPLPAGSRLWQDLSFLAFTLPQVEILMPTKHHAARRYHWRSNGPTRPCITNRLWIVHVNSSAKRCRIVKDRIRLRRDSVRDLVMELYCALHNFRARLTPWQPVVESG